MRNYVVTNVVCRRTDFKQIYTPGTPLVHQTYENEPVIKFKCAINDNISAKST